MGRVSGTVLGSQARQNVLDASLQNVGTTVRRIPITQPRSLGKAGANVNMGHHGDLYYLGVFPEGSGWYHAFYSRSWVSRGRRVTIPKRNSIAAGANCSFRAPCGAYLHVNIPSPCLHAVWLTKAKAHFFLSCATFLNPKLFITTAWFMLCLTTLANNLLLHCIFYCCATFVGIWLWCDIVKLFGGISICFSVFCFFFLLLYWLCISWSMLFGGHSRRCPQSVLTNIWPIKAMSCSTVCSITLQFRGKRKPKHDNMSLLTIFLLCELLIVFSNSLISCNNRN